VRARTSLLERVSRIGIGLYPGAFRRRFGDEMHDFIRLRMKAARRGGAATCARESARLAADLVIGASREWISTFRERRRAARQPAVVTTPRENMQIILQDLRFAIRGLARRPGFTAVAALTLALGIGANTAVFSVVNAVLIRPLPYVHPDELVLIWGTQGAEGGQGVVYPDYLDWRARNHTFAEMGAFRSQSVNLTGGTTPERLIGSFVSASFLRVINAKIFRGRSFTETETELATKAPVAILSYETWRARFGSDPAILGKVININGTPFTVVGITTPNMPAPLGTPDVMVPIGYYPNAKGLERGVRGIAVAARLAPGVSLEAARRDLSAIAKQLEREYPTTNAGTGAEVIALKEQMVGRVRESLYVIVAAVAVVLLIACANVANLQLARGASRARELSVRAALGAGRGRIAQQLLTESVILSIIGGVAGVALAIGLTKVIVALVGPQLPVEATDIRLDLPVLLFALGVSI
jgi:putative ABC transport system permease protein